MPAADRIRLLIVDDHTLFVESLCAVLERQPGLELLTPAHDAEAALRAVDGYEPDVILMDQDMPGMSGAETAAMIHARAPGTAVVMLSGGVSDAEMLRAVEAGITGYLEKTARVSEIVDAVRRAAAGEMLLRPGMLARLLGRARERAVQEGERERCLGALAPREREVLGLMAQGHDTKTISSLLGVSVNTARGYVQHVLEALGAHSRLEAVVRAQELRLLDG